MVIVLNVLMHFTIADVSIKFVRCGPKDVDIDFLAAIAAL